MAFLKANEDDSTKTVDKVNEIRLNKVKSNNEMTVSHNGSRIFVDGPSYITNHLEVGYYVFNYETEKFTCWLEQTDFPTIPSKIYDFHKEIRQNIVKVFTERDKNLGILFKGDKGTGKTIQAKLICKELNLPVIVLDKKILMEVDLFGFLRKIKQDFILFVDEFEKLFENFNSDEFISQDAFLSFLDGSTTGSNKVVSLLTCNRDVNEYLINRPSRIRYLLNFDEMSPEMMNEIINDKLIYKEFEKDLRSNIDSKFLNVDILISIIEEINILKKPFSELKKYFNGRKTLYIFEVEFKGVDGEENEVKTLFSTEFLNPGVILRDGTSSYSNEKVVVNNSLKKLSDKTYQMKDFKKNQVIIIKEVKV